MADIYLAGDAAEVAQVISGTLDSYDAATTYSVTINGKTVSVVGSGGTTSTTATAFRTALNSSTIPEFAEITWGGSTNAITGTCDTPGVPISATLAASGGTGTVTNFSTTTANSGPEAFIAGNCKNASTSARALPVAGDTFTVEALDTNLRYNLAALTGETLAGLYIESSMTGEVGLAPINEDGSYSEYRPRYLELEASEVVVGGGTGDGDGSGLVMLDLQAVPTAIVVRKTASPALDGLPACIIKATHSSNTLKVESGTVGTAVFAGEVATFATLTATGDATVYTSFGTTLGTVNADGESTVDITSAASLSDITAINVRESATVIVRGDNPVTAATVDGESATLDIRSSGTFTTVNLYNGATLNIDDNPNGVTITTLNIYGPCTINDRNAKLTVANAISNWSLVTYNGSPKRSITLGSP